jgi:hypothetical protein
MKRPDIVLITGQILYVLSPALPENAPQKAPESPLSKEACQDDPNCVFLEKSYGGAFRGF